MKCLLVAINAKYIHSNLAVYSLRAYASAYAGRIELAEYTINHHLDDILEDIYRRKPDIIAFSCYIWNIEYVKALVGDLALILPKVQIWLGGPEVSFDCEKTLRELKTVKGIMAGEGEETFRLLMKHYIEGTKELENIPGLVYRSVKEKQEADIIKNPPVIPMDLSRVPFVYQDIKGFENKIIYYESSRGCPFSCSYCLSSVDKQLRFRDVSLVKKELYFFLENLVPQVKFVDRTFNCRRSYALEIWRFILENDNGITNFHFEISADLLGDEELSLFRQMRPGLIQLEIGVQSTCKETLKEIRRYADFREIAEKVRQIKKLENIHCHLDLIAGLPYEGLVRFAESFNDVYALKPHQLQLGFLKVLKGSHMQEMAKEYGLVYKSRPPYEVLFTRWISHDEIITLKEIEEMVEIYYNSGQYSCTIKALEYFFDHPFDMYSRLASYIKQKEKSKESHSRQTRYEFLFSFIEETLQEEAETFRQILTCDYYLRENARNRPAFASDNEKDKEMISAIYAAGFAEYPSLSVYHHHSYRRLLHDAHIEAVEFDLARFVDTGQRIEEKQYLLFNYLEKDKLTGNGTLCRVRPVEINGKRDGDETCKQKRRTKKNG